MKRLIADGRDLDLSRDTVIVPTFQGFTVDLLARRVSYTNEIFLPDTQTNRDIFENANNVSVLADVPYKKLSIDYEEDGAAIFQGGVGLLSSADSGFRLQVYNGVKDFFEKIANKQLSELVFDSPQEAGITWSDATIASLRLINTSDDKVVAAPFIQYGQIDVTGLDFDIGPTLPSLKYYKILEAIIKNAGYEPEGDIFSDSWYKDKIIPYSRSEFNFGAMSKYDFQATRTTPQVISISSFRSAVIFEVVDNTIVLPIPPGNDAEFQNNYSDPRELNMDFTVEIDITVASKTTTFNPLQVSIYNGDSGEERRGPSWLVNGHYSTLLTWPKASVSPGDRVRVVIVTFDSATVTVNSVKWYNKTQRLNNDTTDPFFFPADIVPDLSQTDFVQEFAKMFGVMFNTVGNTLQCRTFNEILSYTSVKNWTSKRNAGVRDRIVYSFGQYAQNNYFLYKDDVDPSGVFRLNNKTLELNLDYFVSIFKSSFETEITDAQPETMSVLTIGSKNSDGTVSYIIPTNFDWVMKFNQDPGLRIASVKPAAPNHIIYNGVSRSDYSLGAWSGLMELQGFIDRYYSKIVAALQRPMIVSRQYKLTVQDVSELSPFDVIQDEGQVYLIISVSQYRKGYMTNVDLLRL